MPRRINPHDVLEQLADLCILYGVPDHRPFDNGPEFVADVERQWLSRLGVDTLPLEPGSPRDNGYRESFNGARRIDLLNESMRDMIPEAYSFRQLANG